MRARGTGSAPHVSVIDTVNLIGIFGASRKNCHLYLALQSFPIFTQGLKVDFFQPHWGRQPFQAAVELEDLGKGPLDFQFEGLLMQGFQWQG